MIQYWCYIIIIWFYHFLEYHWASIASSSNATSCQLLDFHLWFWVNQLYWIYFPRNIRLSLILSILSVPNHGHSCYFRQFSDWLYNLATTTSFSYFQTILFFNRPVPILFFIYYFEQKYKLMPYIKIIPYIQILRFHGSHFCKLYLHFS